MDNKIAKVLGYIGILIIVLGSLSFLLIGLDLSSPALTLGGIAASVIFGVQFMAFGEIVSLLQQSVENQKRMLYQLEKRQGNEDAQKMSPVENTPAPAQTAPQNERPSAK